MELTREKIVKLANYEYLTASGLYQLPEIGALARMLLAELDKPKVWDNAPDEASKCCVIYMHGERDVHCAKYNNYTRTLQKSSEREIAEKAAKEYLSYYGGFFDDKEARLVEKFESAINEYKEFMK